MIAMAIMAVKIEDSSTLRLNEFLIIMGAAMDFHGAGASRETLRQSWRIFMNVQCLRIG